MKKKKNDVNKLNNDIVPCCICLKPLYSGDKVVRALKGIIYDTCDTTSFDINEVLWFHEKCFTIKPTELELIKE